MSKLRSFVESKGFSAFIITIIVINSIALGLLADRRIGYEYALNFIDKICLGIFIVEFILKFIVYKLDYFKNSWRTFDFLVIAIALVPATGSFSILRCFRILRVLRIITAFEDLRVIIRSLALSVKGLFWIFILAILFYYLFAVIGTSLFYNTAPDEFGNLSNSALTLFRLSTLDDWTSIVKAVKSEHPWALLFFIPFIILSAFIVINIFLGVLLNGMDKANIEIVNERENNEKEEKLNQKIDEMSKQILELKALIKEISKKKY